MIVRSKFKEVSLVKNGLLLTLKSNAQKEISLSEIEKVYLKPNKKSLAYAFLYLLSSAMIILFLYSYSLDKTLILALILMVLLGNKLNNYKSYKLKISTKSEALFVKKIPADLRYASIDFINSVRKEIFNYEIRKGNQVINLEVHLPIKKTTNNMPQVEIEKLQE